MHAPKDRKYSQIKCHSRYAGERENSGTEEQYGSGQEE